MGRMQRYAIAGMLSAASLFPGCLQSYDREGVVLSKQMARDGIVGKFYRLELLERVEDNLVVHKYIIYGSNEELKGIDMLKVWDRVEVADRNAAANKNLERLIFPEMIRKRDG